VLVEFDDDGESQLGVLAGAASAGRYVVSIRQYLPPGTYQSKLYGKTPETTWGSGETLDTNSAYWYTFHAAGLNHSVAWLSAGPTQNSKRLFARGAF
jgi:hypothetical protein